MPKAEIAAEYVCGMGCNLVCVPCLAKSQLFKELFLPWIDKTGFFSEHSPPARRLECVDKAVLGHPLLAGFLVILPEKIPGVFQTQLFQYRTIRLFLLEGAVFQGYP